MKDRDEVAPANSATSARRSGAVPSDAGLGVADAAGAAGLGVADAAGAAGLATAEAAPGTAGAGAADAATVREAGVVDAAGLHELAAATFALACPPGTLQSSIDDFIGRHLSEASFAAYLADADRAVLLAEVRGVPVGYTMLVFTDPVDADVAQAITVRPATELSKCYVLPAYHGTAVAGALVEASVDAARARGAAGVWLGVNEHNAKANRFYEKCGFVVVGMKKFLVGEKWEDDFVRERVLSKSS